MEYRLDKNRLLDILGGWNRFLKRKVHLIACGGTAITLIGVKPSTKDVDFMAPKVREHDYLTKQLKALGYKQATGSGWKRDGEDFQFDFHEMVSYDVAEYRLRPNIDHFLVLLREKGLYD